jgi:hypothetical protein
MKPDALWVSERGCAFGNLKGVALYLHDGSDSHSTGVTPPEMFPFVSTITVSVFVWPSHRPSKSEVLKPSLPPRHRIRKCFPRNSVKISGKSEMITEPMGEAPSWRRRIARLIREKSRNGLQGVTRTAAAMESYLLRA